MLAFKRFPSLTSVVISKCRATISTVLMSVNLYSSSKMLGYLMYIAVVRIFKHEASSALCW